MLWLDVCMLRRGEASRLVVHHGVTDDCVMRDARWTCMEEEQQEEEIKMSGMIVFFDLELLFC